MSGVVGGEKVAAALAKLSKKATEQVKLEIVIGATQIQATAVESVQRGTKSGRVYVRGNITHQASAAGEAPASDTGNLARRIELRLSSDGLVARIGVLDLFVAPYARVLELGGEFSEKRPYMVPAYNKHIKAIRQGIRDAVARGLK